MKNYHRVDVPENIKFMSDWEGYYVPTGKCVVDKKVCGCGYTQFCLTNTDNMILCSPRLALLENKASQNSQCFYFQSIILSAQQKKALGLDTDKRINDYILATQKSKVYEYLETCKKEVRPPKFLVTYDSLIKLLGILQFFGVDLDYFKIVVDEFQLIFSDSRFKADVELDFIKVLEKSCKNTCFLSSTPMLKEYLDVIPEFGEIDYYEFFWNSSQVTQPHITKIESDNLEQSILELIGLYREGKGPTKIIDGVEYKSFEAVFYVSNVSMITSVIKKSGLTPDEVNIICSKLDGRNERKIKKCGKGFKIGNAPLKGDPHKMFTFCTSTAFCGVDFYSTNAKSYVFSNCNLETMCIDISLELPQIIGRQRLPENVFRYDIVFYCQSTIKRVSRKEFEEKIRIKTLHTNQMIKDFNTIVTTGGGVDKQRMLIRAGIEKYQYSDDFCGIDRTTGKPIYNNLVYLSELRAWELQNKIYDDDLSVLMVLDTVGEVTTTTGFLDEMVSISFFEDRMKKIIEYVKDNLEDIDKLPDKYRVYFENIPLSVLETISLRKDDLDRRIRASQKNQYKETPEIIREVYKTFSEGNIYLNKEIKTLLSEIYGGTAKANDIKRYFEVTRTRVTNKETGKQDEGYKLTKKKENYEKRFR